MFEGTTHRGPTLENCSVLSFNIWVCYIVGKEEIKTNVFTGSSFRLQSDVVVSVEDIIIRIPNERGTKVSHSVLEKHSL